MILTYINGLDETSAVRSGNKVGDASEAFGFAVIIGSLLAIVMTLVLKWLELKNKHLPVGNGETPIQINWMEETEV